MAFLLRPSLLPIGTIGLGLGLSVYTYSHFAFQKPYRLDSSPVSGVLSGGSGNGGRYSYTSDAKTPVVTRGGRLNPSAVKQMSLGSVSGLCAGLLVSTFSKSLALLLGLMVVGVQVAASYGINIIPYQRLQKYVKGIDLRSAVQDNVALKLSFGTTFALAGFMKF